MKILRKEDKQYSYEYVIPLWLAPPNTSVEVLSYFVR